MDLKEYSLFSFDEFRSNMQSLHSDLNTITKELTVLDEKGDSEASVKLYFYRSLLAIVNAEIKYRSGEYDTAAKEYDEFEKLIARFQRNSSGFDIAYQQEAERLDLYSKGRYAECLALKPQTELQEQLAKLLEAKNAFILEEQIVKKINKPLLYYNAKARINFIQGLCFRLEGQNAYSKKDLRLAKRKYLDAYSYFLKAAYFNSSYGDWINEQNDAIKQVLHKIIKEKAMEEWGKAFKLTSEGKFFESTEICNIASKLFRRASEVASDSAEEKLMLAYSYMLTASMHEAKANGFIKNENNAKEAIRPFELAVFAMKQAVETLPKRDSEASLLKRWESQIDYYTGYFYQAQGIYELDSENYPAAITLFKQADENFHKALRDAEDAKEEGLVKLIQKSIAEAKGYIGMCKTVIE